MSEALVLHIDGVERQATSSQTILQFLNGIGTNIPHLCHHGELSKVGACRMCVVQLANREELVSACLTPIQNGMVITTRSQKLNRIRHWNLQLLLKRHPLNCFECEKQGVCVLHQNYELSQADVPIFESKIATRTFRPFGAMLRFDESQCVRCSLCLRFLNEKFGLEGRVPLWEIDAVSPMEVASASLPNSSYDLNLTLLCPTSALSAEADFLKPPNWTLKSLETICIGCAKGCHTFVDYADREIVYIRPRFCAEINGNFLCNEGRKLTTYHNPTVREQIPSFKLKKYRDEISWTQGIALMGAEIKRLREHQAFSQTAIIVHPYLPLEDLFAVIFLFHEKLGFPIHILDAKDIGLEPIGDKWLRSDDYAPNRNGLELLEGSYGKFDSVSAIDFNRIEFGLLFIPETWKAEAVEPFCQEVGALPFSVIACAQKIKASKKFTLQLPLKTYLERECTFVAENHQIQISKGSISLVDQALSVVEMCEMLEVSLGAFTLKESLSQFMQEIQSQV
jgi:NADH-quinone oxidoreductase subunit G